jgi:hypothetical protein
MEKFKMKKQLIAAAVATSVSAIAMADISITGDLKTNFTHKDYQSTSVNDSDTFTTEGNLRIKGKSGDTSVVMNFGGIDTAATATSTTDASGNRSQMNHEDVYLTTKIGDVNVKMGNYDNGDLALRASNRSVRANLTTELGGFKLSYLNGNGANSQNDEVGISTSLGGVNLTYVAKDGGETIKASTSVGGVNVSYVGLPSDSADSDRDLVELSTTMNGVGIKLGQAKAETGTTITGDSWLGDYESSGGLEHTMLAGQDVTGVELSTSIAGNKLTFRNINVDGYATAGKDWDMNKIIVTRPLTSGATLEVTYKDINDDASTTTDVEVLDIELAVKF